MCSVGSNPTETTNNGEGAGLDTCAGLISLTLRIRLPLSLPYSDRKKRQACSVTGVGALVTSNLEG